MGPIAYVIRLLRWFAHHRRAVSIVGACLVVEMAFNAFVPLAFQRLIDDAITPRNGAVLVQVLIGLGVATLVTTAVGMWGDYVYARLSSGVLGSIRQRLFDHVQMQPPSFFREYSAGEISARYSTDLAAVEYTLGSWVAWGWKPALDVIGYNLVMFSVDWRLALLAQLLWPMVLVGPRFFAPKAGDAAALRKGHDAAVLTAVDEATAARQVVRAFGLERRMSQRFADKVAALAGSTRRSAFFASALERSAGIGILLLQILVLGVGALMAFRGTITVGGLAAFYSVFMSLSYALFYLAQYSTSLIHSAAGLDRIEELLRHESDVPDTFGAVDLPPLRDAIDIREYAYEPEPGIRILDGVTLSIRAGESVVFVGRSGSGKTTMLHAIMRSFDPIEGNIRIDGTDLRAASRASLVRQSAAVFQDAVLYDETIRENVRLGRFDASDADVEAACRDAEIHDVIVRMPRGYDSPVGERGSLLSGGQKQRIAIARALLRNPRILFLDEATSALDPGTEAAVNATLGRIAKGRTVISVTHRLASAVGSDRIFVMEGGRLVEQGTHGDLLAAGGAYAALWFKQDGIETSDDGSLAQITPARLRQFPLLASLDDDMLGALATSQFATERVDADRDVFLEGDPGDRFYIIARGRVDVLRTDADGAPRSIGRLVDGDNFGELALLHDEPRSATIHTLVPCTFLTLQRHHFRQLLERAPAVRAAILMQEQERAR